MCSVSLVIFFEEIQKRTSRVYWKDTKLGVHNHAYKAAILLNDILLTKYA